MHPFVSEERDYVKAKRMPDVPVWRLEGLRERVSPSLSYHERIDSCIGLTNVEVHV